MIAINIPAGMIDAEVSDEEFLDRRKNWKEPIPKITKGYLARYSRMVSSAAEGAVVN
jgi:dihydroxy-acid dehydratase